MRRYRSISQHAAFRRRASSCPLPPALETAETSKWREVVKTASAKID